MGKRQKPPSSSSEYPPQMASTTTIDDLPEGLLTHIISFLPVIEAIYTNSVSSKWRGLWLSSPILHLCIFEFTSRFNPSESPLESRQLFAEFATKVIIIRIRNSSPLHKFQLSFDYQDYDCHKDFVDNWILYAVALKCKVLFLSLKNDGYSHGFTSEEEDDEEEYDYDKFCIYPFDFSSLLNSSVEVLKLQGCNFLPPSASITSLKSLYLENYDFHMDDSMLSELLPLCVNLELLSINGTGGWDNLYISSPSLKELILSVLYVSRKVESSVEICAPKLRVVSFDSIYVGKCILQDVTSLVEARVVFSSKDTKTFHCWSHIIASLTDVERLTVENMWIGYKFDEFDEQKTSHDELDTESDTESIGKNNFIFCGKVSVSKEIFSDDFAFNKLKYLKLLTLFRKRDVLGLGLCLEMCPKLETLVLVNVYKGDVDDDLIEVAKSRPIIMQIPKLRQVKLIKYNRTRNEVFVVGLLKKHKVVLENITAFPAKRRGKPIILWTSSSVRNNTRSSSKAIMH